MKRRQREAEQARLQRAVDAVAGYAIRHRTRKRTVVFEGNLISGNPVEIAAGRPYLPCPDVDGDGFEDRAGFCREWRRGEWRRARCK